MTDKNSFNQTEPGRGQAEPGALDGLSEAKPNSTAIVGSSEARTVLADFTAKSDLILSEILEIKKQIRWQKIWGAVRFLLIAIPIIFGLIYSLFYLPPEVRENLEYYRSLFRP